MKSQNIYKLQVNNVVTYYFNRDHIIFIKTVGWVDSTEVIVLLTSGDYRQTLYTEEDKENFTKFMKWFYEETDSINN